MPLPRYLRRAWPMMPGWVAQSVGKNKQVRVNGVRWDGSSPVRGGDALTLYLPDKYLTGELTVLYRDEDLLGVEKPAALPVDADAEGIGADTLLTRARALDPGARLVHRLDAGTGGCMLLARTEAAEAQLRAAFEGREVKKVYRAVVKGAPGKDGTLTHFLVKDAAGARVKVFDGPRPGALKAVLDWKTIQSALGLSLVEIELHTGRTHQIRAQFARIGCPLLGDDKYGDRALNKTLCAASPRLWCVHIGWRGIEIDSPAPFTLEV